MFLDYDWFLLQQHEFADGQMYETEHEEFEFEYDDVVPDPTSYKLHPIRGVVWATFWGSPIAAGIVMAINYWRLGNKSAARNVALFGFFVTVVLFGSMFIIPEDLLDSIPNIAFLAAQLLLVYIVANSLQSDLIEKHIVNGGTVSSAWPSVGIGVLCIPVLVGVILGAMILLEPSYGTVVVFGDDEVYYSGEATEDDARKLADVLTEVDVFGADGVWVQLHAESGQYAISFILDETGWHDKETIEAFRDIGKSVTEAGFPTPLDVHLCDDYFSVKETIRIR